MKDFEKISTDELWRTIAENAEFARRHTNWVECLDDIRVLVALIDERIEVFQRRMRTEQLLREHRGIFRLSGAGESAGSGIQKLGGSQGLRVLVRGGEKV